MAYDKKAFRTVKHKPEGATATCRNCKWETHHYETSIKNVSTRARYHAQKTLHTVDVYTENWKEYTSYVKDK